MKDEVMKNNIYEVFFMDDQKENNNKHKQYKAGTASGTCLALGVAYGILFHNLAIGICLGVAIGSGIDAYMIKKNKKKE